MKLAWFAALAAFIPLAVLAAVKSGAHPRAVTPPPKTNPVHSRPRALPEAVSEPEFAVHSVSEIIAALPDHVRDLKGYLGDWLKLEAALISDPESVLPVLLDRYAREADPAYKGLLAVLLAAHPSTHRRILEDFRSETGESRELFQGMALFALVAGRRDPRESGEPFWPRLIDLMDFASKEMALKRRILDAPGDGEARRLLDELQGISRWRSGDGEIWCYVSIDRDKVVRDEVGATNDPDVRSTLLDVLGKKWEWNLISHVAQWALRDSAKSDRDFAGTLFREFMDRGDRDLMLKGLDLLMGVELPAEHVATVASIARNSLADRKVFLNAVDLLGAQKGAESEAILADVYAMTRNHEDFKETVLTAMISHKGASFEPIATVELTSSSSDVRARALELLAEVNAAASIEPVVHAFISDPDHEVRCSALAILTTANRWTPREEEALRRVAASDPHPHLREKARRLRDAEKRGEIDWWLDLDRELSAE